MTAAHSFTDDSAIRFRHEVREWLAATVPPSWVGLDTLTRPEDDEIAIKAEWDQLLAATRYRCLTWPTEFGGRELGPIEEVLFAEEAAAAGVPQELELIGKHLVGPSLLNYGTPDQKAKYLPDIAAARTMWCEGLSESNAGSDLAAVRTSCAPTMSGYVVNGRKIWTSYAHQANYCFLLARSDPTGARRHNLTVLMVDMSSPGVSVSPIKQVNGRHEFNEVLFEDVHVDGQNRVGDEHDGWKIVTISGARRLASVGQAPRRYIHLRQEMTQLATCAQGGGFDNTVAEVDAGVELLRWHLRRLAEMMANRQDASRVASIMDLYWSELWQRMTDVALKVACAEHEQYWRRRYLDSRPSTLYGGSAELKRNVISDHILRLPR